LQAAKHWALAGMEEAEGADAETAQRDVLQEAAQELVSGQRHGAAASLAAVAVGDETEWSTQAVMALSERAVQWT
jgi:hypothetical protein